MKWVFELVGYQGDDGKHWLVLKFLHHEGIKLKLKLLKHYKKHIDKMSQFIVCQSLDIFKSVLDNANDKENNILPCACMTKKALQWPSYLVTLIFELDYWPIYQKSLSNVYLISAFLISFSLISNNVCFE